MGNDPIASDLTPRGQNRAARSMRDKRMEKGPWSAAAILEHHRRCHPTTSATCAVSKITRGRWLINQGVACDGAWRAGGPFVGMASYFMSRRVLSSRLLLPPRLHRHLRASAWIEHRFPKMKSNRTKHSEAILARFCPAKGHAPLPLPNKPRAASGRCSRRHGMLALQAQGVPMLR